MGEKFQAAGSRAKFHTCNEEVWGEVDTSSPVWRPTRLIPGETVDQNMQLYRSRQMRGDRMRNATVRGSQRPAGGVPFELSPRGWNNWLWHLLGGSVATTGPVAGLSAPDAPTGTAANTGGYLPAGDYTYKITALNAAGETLPSDASEEVTTTGSVGRVTLTWDAVAGATGYKIYGRTDASWLFLATVGGVTTWVDRGLTTPAGAINGVDTSGSVYTHVITAGVELPTGFTLEKAFTDAGIYFPFYGCRIARGSFDFNIDAMAGGVFEIMAREAGDPRYESLVGAATPQALPSEDPFTSAQVQLWEGDTLQLLGTSRSLNFSIDNNFYGDRGYILGDTLRQNLRPGDRVIELGGRFMFDNAELYTNATKGDRTKLRIVCTNGTYSVQFDFPKFQFLPNNTTPKATDDGPIDIEAKGEALPDPTTGTDCIVTIKTPEALITT